MAKAATKLWFGIHKGKPVETIPLDYLLWVYGAFSKLRNSLRPVLLDRGVEQQRLDQIVKQAKYLGKRPVAKEKLRKNKTRRLKQSDLQIEANIVARTMGMSDPYPVMTIKKGLPARAVKYFAGGGYR
jgi:hypothetical protein